MTRASSSPALAPRSLLLPPRSTWASLLELALSEDLGPGDITSSIAIPESASGCAQIEAREALVPCGLAIAEETFHRVDPEIRFEALAQDGGGVEGGALLARIEGPLRSILTAERTALNFLTRMCGVASFTRRFVEAVAGTETDIVDTRKTLPGWRTLDKYAVLAGGGVNHRVGLFDGILLKDNHIAIAGSVEAAVKAALRSAPANLRVQVEVESEDQAASACDAGADFLLLDNCPPDRIRRIAKRVEGRAVLEATGGVVLENVRDYAEAGVQRISIGALTHSPPAVDVALEIAPGGAAG